MWNLFVLLQSNHKYRGIKMGLAESGCDAMSHPFFNQVLTVIKATMPVME
jgi:hypothetical protein